MGFVASLRRAEALFSPFLPDSEVSLLRVGALDLDTVSAEVHEVWEACVRAREDTGGLFNAWWQGHWNPTGLVKGWAVERAFTAWLEPVIPVGASVPGHPSIIAVGVNTGGDCRFATAPGTDWVWRTGIADPARPGDITATVEITTGAIATSGIAERGAHIVDGRGYAPAQPPDAVVASATVVADTLDIADLWATTAVAAGFTDRSWIDQAPIHSCLLVSTEGHLYRWPE